MLTFLTFGVLLPEISLDIVFAFTITQPLVLYSTLPVEYVTRNICTESYFSLADVTKEIFSTKL